MLELERIMKVLWGQCYYVLFFIDMTVALSVGFILHFCFSLNFSLKEKCVDKSEMNLWCPQMSKLVSGSFYNDQNPHYTDSHSLSYFFYS